MFHSFRPALTRYGFAVIALLVAVAARLAVDHWITNLQPFTTMFLGILVVAGYAGRGPALLTTGIGGIILAYLFLPPRHNLQIHDTAHQVGMVLYLFVGGGIALLGGALRDALQRSEASLNSAVQQREQLRITLASIGDGLIVTDARGRITSMNPVAEELTGWRAVEAVGVALETVFPIVHETSREAVENPVAPALRDGAIIAPTQPFTLIGREGNERPIDASAAPIKLADGKIVGAVLVVRDIAAKRQADRELAQSERRLRFALDAARMVAWQWTPANGSLHVSDNAAEVFGLNDWQSISQIGEGLDLVHPEDVAGYQAVYSQAIAEQKGYLTHYRLIRPRDGAILWMEERGQALISATGATELAGVVLDVTDRKQAEERLRTSEARFRTLFESMDEGFCVIEMLYDADGRPFNYRFLEMNPAFERHSGLRDCLGSTIREVAPDHEEAWYETYGSVARTGEPIRFISEARAMGDRWFDVFAFRLGGAGSPRVAILFNDISARKRHEIERSRLEADLRQLAADLSEADRRKDEFLATLAHELRNPLAPIRNGLQIMKLAGDDRQTIDESRTLMERQVTHMVRLIDDLMDVSRITRNKLELRRDRIDLASVVRNAVETSRPVIEAAGHSLTVTLPDRPIFIDADTTRLAQVFSNLLNNSAKYTESGGEISLTAERDGPEVVVTVRDNGVGIPAEMLPSVFVMFTQVDRTLERAQGGLGIGLSLVKTLVEMHGGSVSAQSDGQGLGSQFIVRLPVVQAAPKPARAVDPAPRPSHSVVKRRILVVDDNLDSARTLARILRLLGHETRLAHDGGAAVVVAEEYRPDLAFLDIGLPIMNGFEVAQAIRARPWGRSIVLVALTGWGQETDRRRSKEAGIDQHLVKPVDPTDLENLLARLDPPPPSLPASILPVVQENSPVD